jgi:oligopeptide transport system permease protein
MNKQQLEKLTKDDFKFVQRDDKIYDKRFETKPIGYFKDAMIRFGKNRTNVIASVILFLMIFLSILVPIVTTKNYLILEEQLAFLPPRVPGLEKIGFMDGTKQFKAQTVDLTTIDPVTGLGLPIGFNTKYILMDTLVNYNVECTYKDINCLGGENQLVIDRNSTQTAVTSVNEFLLLEFQNPTFEIEITSISTGNNEVVEVLYETSPTVFEVVKSITQAGKHTFNVFDETSIVGFASGKLMIRIKSDVSNSNVVLKSVALYDNGSTVPTVIDEGYSLSMYTLVSSEGGGRYVRQNAVLTLADFKFDSYGSVFDDRLITAFPASEYDRILLENPECVSTPDPENALGWLFPEGCPIVKVLRQNSGTPGPDGTIFFSYRLIVDYARYMGYEGIPYFYFGTTGSGKDLFSLTWVALRTSLLIGFIVAFINITVGVVYGSVSGYYGGVTDLIMERFSEVIGRIPWLVTLSIFVALIGPGFWTLILILIVSGWIGVASVTRTQFYRYKGREYVLASRVLGAKDGRLIFRHILPNGIGTIITASVLMIPGVIFAESTISYLGYGIGEGQSFSFLGLFTLSGSSLGVLLNNSRSELLDKPYLTVFPAVIISILMITFNMFGNALRDAFNPSLRGSE